MGVEFLTVYHINADDESAMEAARFLSVYSTQYGSNSSAVQNGYFSLWIPGMTSQDKKNLVLDCASQLRVLKSSGARIKWERL